MLEVRHLLHRFLDESEHLVIILKDTSQNFFLNPWLDSDDVLILLLRQFSQVAVLLGAYCSRRQTVVDNGDFTEEIARSQRLFLSRFLNFLAFLTLRRE